MSRHRFFQAGFLSTLILFSSFLVHSYAVPPTTYDDVKTISFQGRLVSSTGKPVTGSQSVTFEIKSGSSSLWTETQTVSFTNGVFSVTLGSTSPLTSQNGTNGVPADHVFNGDADKTYDVVVTMGGEQFSLPIRRVPSAINSAFLDGFESSEFVFKSQYTAKGTLVVGDGASSISTQTVGADGEVLTADSGQSTGVKWETPPGAWKLLHSVEVTSSTASMDFQDKFSDSYQSYKLVIERIRPVNNNVELIIRLAEAGSSTTYRAGTTDYQYANSWWSAGWSGLDTGFDSEIDLDRGCENFAHSHNSATLNIDRQKDSEGGCFSMYGQIMGVRRPTGQIINRQLSSYYMANSSGSGNGANVASLRVQYRSGNIAQGRAHLYGLVK